MQYDLKNITVNIIRYINYNLITLVATINKNNLFNIVLILVSFRIIIFLKDNILNIDMQYY